MRKPYWLAVLGIVLAAAVVVYLRNREPDDPRVLPASAVNAAETHSNILPADYVGPASCAQCHKKEHQLWSEHPHRFMNQLPSKTTVKGDFSGHVWQVAGGATVTFTMDSDAYVMALEHAGTLKRYKVTRTVGSRFMQFYVGVQLDGPEPKNDPAYRTEHKLPFGYWFRLRAWLPISYFDRSEPEEIKDGAPVVEGIHAKLPLMAFTEHCMNCHNTYPYAYRIYRKDFCGFPDATVAATIGPLSAALSDKVPVEPNLRSFATLPHRMNPDEHLVTLGISCESCHLGGREHARDERERIRFGPISRFVRVTSKDSSRPLTGQRDNAATINGICAQCHSAAVPTFPNGAGISNSREAADMRSGACVTQLSCIHCHEPHTAGPPSGGLTLAHHLDACTECHPHLAKPEQVAAHSRHPLNAKVDCLDCHMPRYNQGLDDVVRTHRIAVPVEKSMASKGLANACNLCHLDKSLNWTLAELERGWQRKLEPGPDWAAAYGGSLDRPVGEAWLTGSDAATRLVAADAWSRSPLGKRKLPEVARALNDPVPVNRSFAWFAVERLLGRSPGPSLIDITAAPAERKRQIDALIAESARAPAGPP